MAQTLWIIDQIENECGIRQKDILGTEGLGEVPVVRDDKHTSLKDLQGRNEGSK